MRADKAFYAVTLVLVLMGACSLALSGYGGAFALASLPLCVGNWYWAANPRRRYLPDWLATVICMVALVGMLATVGGAGTRLDELYTNVPRAGALLLLVQWVMLFRRKTARDYAWIYLLAFMMLVCTALMVPEIQFLLAFLVMLLTALCGMTLLHIRTECERTGTPFGGGGGFPPRRVGRRFVRNHAAVTFGLLLPTAVLFVVLPRGRPRRLSVAFRPVQAGNPVVGFSETVELGAIGAVLDNPTRVMNVEVFVDGRKAGPGYVPLMRGLAFDLYDGRRWTTTGTAKGGNVAAMYEDDFDWYFDEPAGQEVRCEVVLEPLNTRILFAPFAAEEFLVQGQARGPRLRVNDVADSVELVRISPQRVLYTSLSRVIPQGRDGPRRAPARARRPRRAYLSLPRGLPARVRRLARDIAPREQYPSELGVARRIESYLFHNYRYTLNPPPAPPNRDPVDFFLFESQEGYCEHYASAMVLLLRCRGIPARLVAGFKGGTYNEIGGYFVIRQSDAHAWVEAYLRPYGWVTFDPTGPSESQRNPRPERFGSVADLLDYQRSAWIRHVVSFDYIEQSRVYRWARGVGKRLGTRLRGLVVRVRPDVVGEETRVEINLPGVAVLLGAAAVVAVLLVRRLRRLRRRRPLRSGIAFYRRMERLFAARGLPRPAHMTPVEFAEVVAERFPPCAEPVRHLTRRFCEVYYAGLPLPPQEAAALLERVRGLRRLARPPGRS